MVTTRRRTYNVPINTSRRRRNTPRTLNRTAISTMAIVPYRRRRLSPRNPNNRAIVPYRRRSSSRRRSRSPRRALVPTRLRFLNEREKPYCGYKNPPPKNRPYGTMRQCQNSRQIRRYGIVTM